MSEKDKIYPIYWFFFFNFGIIIPYYCAVQKKFVKNVKCYGQRQFVFEGENFCEFSFEQENSVWIASNRSRFDTVFIL